MPLWICNSAIRIVNVTGWPLIRHCLFFTLAPYSTSQIRSYMPTLGTPMYGIHKLDVCMQYLHASIPYTDRSSWEMRTPRREKEGRAKNNSVPAPAAQSNRPDAGPLASSLARFLRFPIPATIGLLFVGQRTDLLRRVLCRWRVEVPDCGSQLLESKV